MLLSLVVLPLFFDLLDSFFFLCENFSQLSHINNFVVIACILDDEDILGLISFMAALLIYTLGILVGMWQRV
jgi:hypothetical protein